MNVKNCLTALLTCTLLTVFAVNVAASPDAALAKVESELQKKQEDVDSIEAELTDTVDALQAEYKEYIADLESNNQQLQVDKEDLSQRVDEYADVIVELHDDNIVLMKIVPRQQVVLRICAGVFGFMALYFIYVFNTNYRMLRASAKSHIRYAFAHILRYSSVVDRDRCFHMLKSDLLMNKTKIVILTYEVRINLVNFFIWKQVLRNASVHIRLRSGEALPFIPVIVQNLNSISRKFPNKLDVVFDCPNSIEAYKIIYGSTYATSFINPGSKINFIVKSRQNLPGRYVMNVADSVYGSEVARGNRLPRSLGNFQNELSTYSNLFQQILDSTVYKEYVLQCAVEFVDFYGIPLTIKYSGRNDFKVPKLVNIVSDGQVLCINYNSMKLYEDLKSRRSAVIGNSR